MPAFADVRQEMLAYFQKKETLPPEALLEKLRADGPGGAEKFMALGAWVEGELAGFAVFSPVYAIDVGTEDVFLSDFFVRQAYRRSGIGKNLMAALARLCLERGWPRIDWHVYRLDFDARTFYDMLNPDSFKLDHLSYRVEGDEIAALAAKGEA